MVRGGGAEQRVHPLAEQRDQPRAVGEVAPDGTAGGVAVPGELVEQRLRPRVVALAAEQLGQVPVGEDALVATCHLPGEQPAEPVERVGGVERCIRLGERRHEVLEPARVDEEPALLCERPDPWVLAEHRGELRRTGPARAADEDGSGLWHPSILSGPDGRGNGVSGMGNSQGVSSRTSGSARMMSEPG